MEEGLSGLLSPPRAGPEPGTQGARSPSAPRLPPRGSPPRPLGLVGLCPSGSTLPSLLCQLSRVPALDSAASCGSPWQLLHSSALTVGFAEMQTRPVTDARSQTSPGPPRSLVTLPLPWLLPLSLPLIQRGPPPQSASWWGAHLLHTGGHRSFTASTTVSFHS